MLSIRPNFWDSVRNAGKVGRNSWRKIYWELHADTAITAGRPENITAVGAVDCSRRLANPSQSLDMSKSLVETKKCQYELLLCWQWLQASRLLLPTRALLAICLVIALLAAMRAVATWQHLAADAKSQCHLAAVKSPLLYVTHVHRHALACSLA